MGSNVQEAFTQGVVDFALLIDGQEVENFDSRNVYNIKAGERANHIFSHTIVATS